MDIKTPSTVVKSLTEVNFGENNHESIDIACSKGFTLDSRSILAAPALQPDAKVVRVNLSNLPFLRSEELEPGLRLSLACYGRILDVGICRDAELGVYMGNGYAVLDCHRPGGEQVYVPLQHHIPWKSSQDGFYATWKNMPLHCMFCHQQGHNRNDCPLPPINKVVCYNCDEKGHIQSTCPRGLTRNKRLRGNGLTTSTIRTSTQNNKKTNTQRTTNSEDEKPNETQEKPELFQPIVYDPNDDPNESDYQEEDEFSENEEMIDEAKGEILPPGTAPRAQGTDHFVFFDPNNVQGSGLSPNGTIDNQQLPGSTPNDNSGTSASFPLNQ